MVFNSEEKQAIYGTADFSGAICDKIKLSSTDVKLSLLKFEWLVSYKRVLEEQKFVISVKLSSRYLLADTQHLKIILEHKGSELKNQEFQLEKIPEKQIFEIKYDEKSNVKFKYVDVYATLETRSMSYYLDNWATESNFKRSTRAHDVVLIVGETKFYVHRNYLATWSRYFDRLFFGDFKEKDQQEIAIKEVDAVDFEHLLGFMHPQLYWAIDEANTVKMLELADRFEIPNIMARCGTLLCNFDNYKDLSLMDRLEMGCKYNLAHLQIACFERVHKMAAVEYFNFFTQNRDRIKKLSEMTVKNLI